MVLKVILKLVSLHFTGDISVRRTQSAFETETKTLLTSKLEAEEETIPQDEISDEENRGSQSPLLVKRHQSLEVRPSIERHHPTSVSSRSLDRHLEDRGCSNSDNRKAVLCIRKSTSSLVSSGGRNEANDDESKKIEVEAETSDISGGGCSDVEIALSNFQAEIDEATQALLKASQCE